jgi:hypothetical protein
VTCEEIGERIDVSRARVGSRRQLTDQRDRNRLQDCGRALPVVPPAALDEQSCLAVERLPRCIDALFRADEIQFGAGRLHVAAVRLQR